MKVLFKFVLLSAMLISFTGCQKSDEVAIYQLSNQSYSQMMSYIIEDEGTTIVVDGGTAEDEENLIKTIIIIKIIRVLWQNIYRVVQMKYKLIKSTTIFLKNLG